MLYPQQLPVPATPAQDIEDAEGRLLTLLQAYASMKRFPYPKEQGSGLVKMYGEMNIWMSLMQAGVGVAFSHVTGKPVPDEFAISQDTKTLWAKE